MFTGWRSLYEAALREQDSAKLPELCQQARLARLKIHERKNKR